MSAEKRRAYLAKDTDLAAIMAKFDIPVFEKPDDEALYKFNQLDNIRTIRFQDFPWELQKIANVLREFISAGKEYTTKFNGPKTALVEVQISNAEGFLRHLLIFQHLFNGFKHCMTASNIKLDQD